MENGQGKSWNLLFYGSWKAAEFELEKSLKTTNESKALIYLKKLKYCNHAVNLKCSDLFWRDFDN